MTIVLEGSLDVQRNKNQIEIFAVTTGNNRDSNFMDLVVK